MGSTGDDAPTAPRATRPSRCSDRVDQRQLGRRERRPRARGRAHGARRDQRRDVGGDQRLPARARPRRPSASPATAARTRSSPTSRAAAALFWGVASRTMLRDEAYAFLDAGGRFEGADMVLRMLRVALPAPRRAERHGSRCATGRRSRCCTRSAASRPTAAPSRRPERRAGRELPALHAQPTPTRSPPRSPPSATR